MVRKGLTLAQLALVATGFVVAQPVLAQDGGSGMSMQNTEFRGFRVEGNLGGDRFQSEGEHNDKFGYGATVGFDGSIAEKFVVGAEGSYWRTDKGNENCKDLADGNSICHKAFREWGAAIRAGMLVQPNILVFGKGGYVNAEQRRRIDSPGGTQLVYDHYRADGYQLGGGVELAMQSGSWPIYANLQYVYSNYHGHSARQRVMAGIGVRFP